MEFAYKLVISGTIMGSSSKASPASVDGGARDSESLLLLSRELISFGISDCVCSSDFYPVFHSFCFSELWSFQINTLNFTEKYGKL